MCGSHNFKQATDRHGRPPQGLAAVHRQCISGWLSPAAASRLAMLLRISSGNMSQTTSATVRGRFWGPVQGSLCALACARGAGFPAALHTIRQPIIAAHHVIGTAGIDKAAYSATQVSCSREERATSGYLNTRGASEQRTLYLLVPCWGPAPGGSLLRPSTTLSAFMLSCSSCALHNADLTNQ